jgi:hypothetical protein
MMRSRLIVTVIARPFFHPIPIALSREETPRASFSPLYPHPLPFRLTAAPIVWPPCCLVPRHFQPRGLRRRSERPTRARRLRREQFSLSLVSNRTAHNLSTTGYRSASSSRPTSSTWSAARSKLPSSSPRATSELRPAGRRGRSDVVPSSSRARVPWHVGYHVVSSNREQPFGDCQIANGGYQWKYQSP